MMVRLHYFATGPFYVFLGKHNNLCQKDGKPQHLLIAEKSTYKILIIRKIKAFGLGKNLKKITFCAIIFICKIVRETAQNQAIEDS